MKVVIIGGVGGGATAAARLRRLSEKAEIIMLERGGYISFANCGLPYYVGGVIPSIEDVLLQDPASFKARYNIEARIFNEVIEIDSHAKKLKVKDIKNDKEYIENYDKLLIATGADPLLPPIEGLKKDKTFFLKDVEDAFKLRDYIVSYKPSKALVIGASYIGIEIAENLKELGLEVILLEKADQILPVMDIEMAAMLQSHLKSSGVELYTADYAVNADYSGDMIKISLDSGREIQADIVVASAGIRPNSQLAAGAGLNLSERKAIKVDEYCMTSDKNIYAVGDAVESKDASTGASRIIALAGPANRQAVIAVENIVKGNSVTCKASSATAILKVFDMTGGITGSSEKSLNAEELRYSSVIIHRASHASYYPGAQLVSIKLIFDLSDGRVLGAQVVGREGVDKALEVLSIACQNRLSVYDLKSMDPAYAPPFSSAKSPVNIAGSAAENILKGLVNTVSWEKIGETGPGDLLVDVRTKREYSRGHIPNAVNIPVDELRDRLGELDPGKRIYIYCAVGLRAYLACRILMENSYSSVYNLSGGFMTYSSVINIK